MNTSSEILNTVKAPESASDVTKTSTLAINVLVRNNNELPDNREKPVAAFTSETCLKSYLKDQPDSIEYFVERMNLDYNPNQPLEYLYLAYILTNNNKYHFAGYYINRFEAQRRILNRGYIRSIPLFLDSENASATKRANTRIRRKRGASQLFDDLNLSDTGETVFSKIKIPNNSTRYQIIAFAIVFLLFVGTVAFWII